MKTECAKVQVVEVISEHRLRDADDCEWRYWRRDGKPLAVGFYVVSGPGTALHGKFCEDCDFRGPYPQRSAAQAALEELKASLEAHDPRALH